MVAFKQRKVETYSWVSGQERQIEKVETELVGKPKVAEPPTLETYIPSERVRVTFKAWVIEQTLNCTPSDIHK